jgi:hypothetical protein
VPAVPSVFPLWRIALTAVIAAVIGFAVLRWRLKELPIREAALAVLVVGLSVLAWRLSANVPQFNDDPIPPLSPNDWLCPILTYVCLELYAAFHPPAALVRWQQARALLTVVAFVVNVLVI